MKVLKPVHKSSDNILERQLQRVLEKSQLDGYALLGFSFRNARGVLHEIDAVLILSSGVFVSLEAKNYAGLWTGNQNEKWYCDGQEIKAIGTNPYEQSRKYAFVLKECLESIFCPYGVRIFVHHFIVAPDQAQFKMPAAILNRFESGSKIFICNLSRLEATIAQIPAGYDIPDIFKTIGIETIVRLLADLSPDTDLDQLCSSTSTSSSPKIKENLKLQTPQTKQKATSTSKSKSTSISTSTSTSTSISTSKSISKPTSAVPQRSIPTPPNQQNLTITKTRKVAPHPSQNVPKNISKNTPQNVPSPIKVILSLLLGSGLTIVALLSFILIRYWAQTPLAKEAIIIGAVNSEKQYQDLQNYLDQHLIPQNFFQTLSGQDTVVILQASKSDRPNPYPEAIAKIRNYEWDVVFSYSPVIAMEAEDQGYQFIAQMFPGTSGYQSTFFVRENSSIEFNQLSSRYTIALGDFFSASKFYMPVYDLYGASLQVIPNQSSKDIYQLVQDGNADIGVGVINEKLPKGLKIIQTTRDLPSSGVYLSPKLSLQDSQRLTQLLLNAPQAIKDSANYDWGTPPDYQYFRGIVNRVREVSACSNFAQNPVAFTCGDRLITTIEGDVSHIEIAGQVQHLSITQASGSICKVAIQDSVLRMAVRYNSVFELKGWKLRFYVGIPSGKSCTAQDSQPIYQPNQIEILSFPSPAFVTEQP